MSIENITPGSGLYRASKSYFNAKKKSVNPVKGEKTSESSASDKVEISSQAKELREKDALIKEYKEALKKLPEPEVRKEKVGLAINRMITGYYDNDKVKQGTAEAISQSQITPDKSNNDKDVNSEIDWDKIKVVQQRIMDNYYDNNDVIRQVIEKLLNL